MASLQLRWDKISAWKGKIDEHEMVDAELTRSHVVSRSAADVKVELDLVARLISGLPTNVEPGEYEAALATHLTSLSTALQLELEQTPEESGTNCSVRHHCAVVPLAITLGEAIMGSYICACTAAAESTPLDPEPSANAEPNSAHANVSIVRTRSLPSLLRVGPFLRAGPSYRSAFRNLGRFRSHVAQPSRCDDVPLALAGLAPQGPLRMDPELPRPPRSQEAAGCIVDRVGCQCYRACGA